MRVYGRTKNPDGTRTWVAVETDPATGSNDAVNCVWLAQSLQLIQGESPFSPSWGVPVYKSIQTQAAPTTALRNMQTTLSPYFAYLRIMQMSQSGAYSVKAITLGGTAVSYVFNGSLPQ